MIFVKSFLISVLIVEGIFCSISDIRTNKIPNNSIICGLLCALIANFAYFILADDTYFFSFILNVISAAVISFIMYALHIWAGGDVKLFVLMAMLVPAEFYRQKAPLSIVTIYITIFSVAFIYLIIESIVLMFLKERATGRLSVKISAKPILSCMVSIMAFQVLLRLIFQGYYYDYLPLFLLLNVILVLAFNRMKFLNHNLSIIICSLISGANLVVSIANNQYKVELKTIIVAVVVMCFRTLAERFNYQEIDTLKVKKGMILSIGTVVGFSNSRVKGLPQFTTEDIASRLTQEEADSIKRWATSKNGKDKITVLRKIPFAIFISLGFIFYLMLGVFVW